MLSLLFLGFRRFVLVGFARPDHARVSACKSSVQAVVGVFYLSCAGQRARACRCAISLYKYDDGGLAFAVKEKRPCSGEGEGGGGIVPGVVVVCGVGALSPCRRFSLYLARSPRECKNG